MDLTEQQLVEYMPQLSALIEEHDKLLTEYYDLREKINGLESIIDQINQVNEVFEDIPLRIWHISKDSYDIFNPVDPDAKRAHVYLNMHTEKDWCITINCSQFSRDIFCGMGWTKEEAFLAARLWAAYGIPPKKDISANVTWPPQRERNIK